MKKYSVTAIALALCLTLPSCTSTADETSEHTDSAAVVTTPGTITDKETLPAQTEAETDAGFKYEPIEISRTIHADHASLLDVESNTVLFQQGGLDTKLYPASTTKLITALVALKYCDLDTVFTAGEELSLVRPDSSIAYIKRGHKLTVDMLIAAMLLPSGNDAAYVVAAGAGKIIANDKSMDNKQAVNVFINQMNEFAQENSLNGSHFTCPDGYHDNNHYTTLNDMMTVGKLALENETIMKYAGTHSLDVTYASGHTNSWTNTNNLIDQTGPHYYKFATGLKTGTTSEAGCCLMVSAEKDGRKVIACIFGADTNDQRYADALNLLKSTLGSR